MLGGRDLRAMRPLDQARRRALLGQEPRAASPFTLEDVVGLGLFARGLSLKGEQARAQIGAALQQVGLTHLAQRRISEVSGGEARRTHLARVMVQVWEAENCLLLLDEPTTGLDLVHLEALERAVAGFAARGGSVVIAAHDLGWARRTGQQAIIVADGRIGGQGPVGDLLTPQALAPIYQVEAYLVQRALAVG
jgi:iron complex transport system ATP-binding protein